MHSKNKIEDNNKTSVTTDKSTHKSTKGTPYTSNDLMMATKQTEAQQTRL